MIKIFYMLNLDVKRSEVHLVPHEKKGEEFTPRTNESSSFSPLDVDEFPDDFFASITDMIAITTQSPADND